MSQFPSKEDEENFLKLRKLSATLRETVSKKRVTYPADFDDKAELPEWEPAKAPKPAQQDDYSARMKALANLEAEKAKNLGEERENERQETGKSS